MKDIQVNEYVRLKGGSIQKVLSIQPYFENNKNLSEYDYISTENLKQWKRYQFEEIVVKHSFNIIDIIEEGDYVNGYKVSFILKDIEKFVLCDYPVEEGIINHYKFYNRGIESVVAREQFEKMEYKVC